MNRAEFTAYLSKRNGWSRKEAEENLKGILEAIEELLSEGENVKLTGFGSFEVKKRSERPGRNVNNPEEIIMVPAHYAPVFHPGKNLKKAVER